MLILGGTKRVGAKITSTLVRGYRDTGQLVSLAMITLDANPVLGANTAQEHESPIEITVPRLVFVALRLCSSPGPPLPGPPFPGQGPPLPVCLFFVPPLSLLCPPLSFGGVCVP